MYLEIIKILSSLNNGISIGFTGGPTGISAGTIFDLTPTNMFLDLNNLKSLTAGSVSRTGNIIYYDSSETSPVKTKKVAINKLLSDSFQTFVGKGSKVVVEKGTDTVQFDVATGEVSSSNQNLITGATAFAYIQQNTVSTFDGRTGNITIVDGGTY